MNMTHFIKFGDLRINVFTSLGHNVIWLGVSGLTLHFTSYKCKGHKPTSKIKTFDYIVKKKVLSVRKR